jgi:hypothetical protein
MEKKASQVQRAGYWLKCPICDGEKFWHREAQLNTRVMSLLDLDWVNPRATVTFVSIVAIFCGFIPRRKNCNGCRLGLVRYALIPG